MSLGAQVAVLFILAIPIAAISWTITHEEVLREPREWCVRRSRLSRSWYLRKLFYVFTCEYCFSHWVTMAFLVATRFTLLYPGPLGYVVAGFSLVLGIAISLGLRSPDLFFPLLSAATVGMGALFTQKKLLPQLAAIAAAIALPWLLTMLFPRHFVVAHRAHTDAKSDRPSRRSPRK